jgi:CRP-like cAMP-binding protein
LTLTHPEEAIITQGTSSEFMYIIAHGQCEVVVRDHTPRDATHVRFLHQGDYFGELGLLNGCLRSASVKSHNYSTLMRIGSDVFFEMIGQFPDIILKMKEHALKYDDSWK